MTQDELKVTWKAYLDSKIEGTLNRDLHRKLVEHYGYVVRIAAQKMHQKHPQLTVEELASLGVDGLMQAVEGYETTHNTKFETYAMPRIRGSMLDEIRKSDWVPRLVRSNSKWLDKQRSIYESIAGHKLKTEELWECISDKEKKKQGIKDLEEFSEYVEASYTTMMHSVNDIQSENDQGKSLSIEHIQDKRAIQPVERMLRKELFDKLMGKNFTKQEQKIMWLYYFEDLSMKEISDKVDLSESRVSQMHKDIKDRLQQKAIRNPDYFADIWSTISEFKEAAVAC